MNELVGAWRLAAAQFLFADGGAADLYGGPAEGRVLFTADGWMSVVITSAGAPAADGGGAPVTVAYSGRYRTETGRFITAVDVASVPPWVGTEQIREYEVAGDELSMVLGMPVHPSYPDRPGRGKLSWKRE